MKKRNSDFPTDCNQGFSWLLRCVVMFSMLIGTSSWVAAQTLYWDTDGDATGNATDGTNLGGSGTWNTSTVKWWDATAMVVWPNTNAANASFTYGFPSSPYAISTPFTVTMGEPITANRLTFKRSGYTVTGDSLTLAGAAAGIYTDLGESATIASILAGSAGLTKTGGGSVRLTNVLNEYTGDVTIAGGSIIISSAIALGGAGTVNVTAGNSTPSNALVLGFTGGSLVLDGSTAGFTFSRDLNLEGRGPIGQNGAALLSIGNNEISGTVTTAFNTQTPATFRNTRLSSANGMLTLSGTLNVLGTAGTTITTLGGGNQAGIGNYNLTGILAGTGTLEKSGGGTLFLNPSDTSGFTGRLRISGSAAVGQSSVRVSSANVFGVANGTTTSAPIDLNGGVLEIRSDSSLNFGKNVYTRSTGNIFTGPAEGGAEINGTTTFGTLQHVISTTVATATTTFNSRNGYGVTFSTMAMDASTSTSSLTNTLTNNMGGNLTFTGNITLGEGSIASRPRVLAIGGSGNTVILGSVIAGTDTGKTMTKSGVGSLTIQGVGTTVAGTISVTAGAIIATDFRSLNNNTAAISLGNATTTGGNLIIGGTATAPTAAGLTTSKTITLNTTSGSNSIYANQTGVNPVILNGAITKIAAATTGALILGGTNTADNIINVVIPVETTPSTGGVTKIGSGTWVLNNANTYRGATTIQNGTLKLRATAVASDVIGELGTNTIVFSGNTATGTAGGILEFRGFSGAATTETLGALTPTAGAATVRLLGNGASAANLTFTSLGATTAASSVNFDTTGANGGVITLTGQGLTSATNLPGTVNFQGHLYINGTNFATTTAAGVVEAPTYGGAGNFRDAGPALVAATHNRLTAATASGALTVSSLVTNSQALTLSGNLVVSTGGILQSGGTATIQSDSGTSRLIQGAAAATNVAIRVDGLNDVLNIGSAANPVNISSITTGGLTKNGAGKLVFFGTNAQTGTVNLNEGSIELNGTNARLAALAGVATVLRQNTFLEFNTAVAYAANPTVAALDGAGTIRNIGSADVTLVQTGAGTWAGSFNETGSGKLNVSKLGTTGAPIWQGLSNYTGVTTIGGTTGSVTVDFLTIGGDPSSIGASSNAAANLVFSGSTAGLIYRGDIIEGALTLGSRSATTDRLFTLAGTGVTLGSSQTTNLNNAIVWSNPGAIVHAVTGPQTVIFTGTSQGDNRFIPQLTDSGTVANITSVTKTGTGIWHLGAANNTYRGATLITQGILGATNGAGLSSNSNLQFDGGTLYSQGNFTRNIGTGAGEMQFLAPAANTAQFSGGFLGGDSKLTVNWAGTPVWGGGAGFLDTRNGILLNGSQARAQGATGSIALSEVEIAGNFSLGTASGTSTALTGVGTTSASATLTVASTAGLFVGQSVTGTNIASGAYIVSINSATQLTLSGNSTATATGLTATGEAGALRAIRVDDNATTGADFAKISGTISAGDATTGIRKLGGGTLALTGANTYTGETNVNQGFLEVLSLGQSGSVGATSVGDQLNANLNGSAITLGNGGTGGASLQYVGAGEISDRKIRLNSTTGSTQIHSDGAGPLILTNVANDMVAGAKTFFLRGTNNAGNMITSQLSDNGGALSVTIDSNATWILTNAANDYTGLTTVSGGALGIGHDTAIGGNILNSNGNIFAYGGDRTVANILTLNNNANWGFLGDYNLTFSNAVLGSSANSNVLINSIAAGKALTFTGLVANLIDATRNFTVDGPGETIINGDFTTSTAFGVQIIKTGDGTLTLGGNGTVSNWNQVGTGIDVDRGTLKFITNNAINSTAGYAGLTISPELLDGDIATVNLNGTVQTVNALTATSNGTLILDNTSAAAATFRFGANNSNVNFGSGVGTYSVLNTGDGALSLVKLGNTTATFISGITLAHEGITASEGGGAFNIASPLTATTGLRVIDSSSMALSGGLSNPNLISSVIVDGGSTLSLLDGVGSQLGGLDLLTLGSTGGTMTTLNLNVGDSTLGDRLNTDLFALLNTATLNLFTGNQISLFLTDTGLNPNQQYNLFTFSPGGFINGNIGDSDWILGNTIGGFTFANLVATNDRIYLDVGAPITGDLYWRGAAGGGIDNTWNAALNNWSGDKANTVAATTIPGQGTNVIFAIDSTSGAVTTTLEQNFRINSLVFEAGTSTPSAVIINPGTLATARLEVAPQNSTDGIAISTGGPAAVTIGANLRLGSDQTWNVADANSVLTIGGTLLAEADVIKSGPGKVILTAAADPTFNAGQTATFTVTGGNLEFTNSAALGTNANSNVANIVVSGGGFYYNNAVAGTALTLPHNITLSGGSLSGGGANHTYGGLITVNGASTINMADSNGAPDAAARSITLAGGLTGPGNLTVNSNNTVGSGNQIGGTLTLNQDNSAWSGDWNILRGTVSTNHVNGLGSGDSITFERGRIQITGTAGTRTIHQDITVVSATGTSVGELNFASGIASEIEGNVILGGAGGFGELRIAMGNDAATVSLNGGVVLANNGGLGTLGAATRVLTVNSVISETGGPRTLTINDAGWGGTAGTVALAQPNTYTGGTNLARGILRLDHKNALLNTGTLAVTGSSTLQAGVDLSGADSLTNLVTLGNSLVVSGSNNLSFAGAMTHSGGNWTLTNSLTGGANLLVSQLNLAESSAAAARTLTIAGASTGTTTINTLINNDQNNILTNSLSGSGAFLSVGTIALSEASGTGRNLTLQGAGNTTVTGVIENVAGGGGIAGTLTKAGTGVLTLQGANTFTGPVVINAGVLEYNTVTNIGGAASNLGQGSAISMTGGTLRFIGTSPQSTDRPITTATGAVTLSANGATATDTITYTGAITVGPTADGSQLVLAGAAERVGIITGGFTQTGTTADVTHSSGTWTLSGTQSTVADDFVVTGTSTVLNLDSTAVVRLMSGGGGADLTIRNGGVVNINALNAVQYTGSNYRLFVGQGADGADAILNLNANLQSGRMILGERSLTRVGIINGPGTLTVDNAATDFIQLYRGEINANIASNGTGAGIFRKVGSGTVTLRGDNSGLTNTGTTQVDNGTLVLDYTLSNATKLNSARQLDMRGATLQLIGSDTAPTVQNVQSFTMATGQGNNLIDVTAGTGQTATLALGAITRAGSAGTLRINLNNSGAAVTTTTGNTNGLVGSAAHTTVKDVYGTWFGTNVSNSIIGLESTLENTVANWVSGDHITDGGSGFMGHFDRNHISSLRFNAAGGSVLSAASQASVLTIASGGILVTDQVTAGSPGIFGGTLGTGATEIIVTQDGSQVFEISSRIGVNNAFTKTGPGTVLLSGNNAFTGQTSVQNGTLQISGGNAIGDNSLVTLASNRNTVIQLLESETIGRLQGGQAATNSHYGTVAIGSHTLTLNHTGGTTTYAGFFTGSGGIVLSPASASTLNMTNNSSGFTGTVEINGGLFQLSGIGRNDASSFTINGNGMMLIDNNTTTSSTARILDSTPIILNSAAGGGTNIRGLWVRNTDNSSSRFETVGNLVFNSGANYLTGEANVGTGDGRAGVTANDFIRNDNATVSVRGRNLGTTLTHHNQFRIGTSANQTAFISNLVGGAGSAGSATLKIVPWAVGETHNATTTGSTNMGNSLVTYVSGAGFRPLDLTTEYAPYATSGGTNNTRESITADLIGLAGRTLNALVIHNNSADASALNVTGAGAGNGLLNTSGTFLFTLNPAAAASSVHTLTMGGFDDGISVAGSEYLFFVQNPSAATTTPVLTTTIGSQLISAADITKSWRGTLILNQINTAGGGANKTTINEGILEIADLDNLGGGTGALVFAGGTLRLGTGFIDDISTRTIRFLTGGGTLDTNGIDLTLANSLGSGVGGFTKTGAGNLTLNAAATYTGNTVLSLGTVTVGANNALGNGGNLTLAAGTTLALGTNSVTHNLVTTGGASPLITGTGTINASGGFAFNHTGDTQIEAVLAGAEGLFKTQNNIVTLTGLNTYTGTTEVRAGGLSFDSLSNVGAGPSALGNPTTVTSGIIRMGLTTAATSLTYTGLGHSSDRLIGIQGTTGGVSLFGNGTGAIGYGGARFETPGNKTLTLRGISDPAIINSIGALHEQGGVMTVNKADANTWMVSQVSSYTGVTQIDNGTLMVGINDALPVTTTVRLGTGATAGTLDLNGFDQTIGSLLVQTNNNAVTNHIIVDTGKTLTINGAVTLGVNANESDTNLNASGGGAIVVNSGNLNFQIGGATGDNENRVDVDFTGLANFTANLGTGTFRLGDANTGTGNSTSTFKLATNNTITAALIRIGDGTGGTNTHTLTLGSGTNLLNANTINIGSAGTSIRSGGSVIFDAADTTGTLTVRASNGTDRATINLINTTGNTLGDMQSTMDLTGHTADILASTLSMAVRSANAGFGTASLSFNQGTLDVTTLVMASRTGTGTGNATATLNIGGGAAIIGSTTMAVNTSAGGTVAADLNVSGGTVTIGTGSGTAINMANAAASRTVTSNINLTGGTVDLTGNILRTGGAGTENATVTLNGSTLNMNANSIGSSTSPIVFVAQAGALSGLAELNGGSVLTKSTAGSLSLGNGNTYTGGTTVSVGSLFADNTTGSATGSGSVLVTTGATLGGAGVVIPGLNNSVTIESGATLTVGNLADTEGSDLMIATSGTGVLTINGKVEFDIWAGAGDGDNSAFLATADRLVIGGGDVILGGTLAINNPTPITSWMAGDIWRLFDWSLATSVTGNFTNITDTVGNFNDLPDLSSELLGWDTTHLYSQGTISVVVIPEPSRVLLLLLGSLGLVMRRRRN